MGGFCLQYDVLLMQACESFGLPGRMSSTSPGSLGEPKGVGGHEPGEIWSNQYRKWVYMDGTGAWYAVDSATGVPLSLWSCGAGRSNSCAASLPIQFASWY